MKSRTMIAVALICVTTAATASPIPLLPGDYIASDQGCSDAPLAAMVHYDGRGFGGANAGRCASTVVAQHSNDYRIRTTCRTLGDGSATRASTVAASYRITSRTTFVTGGIAYRRCGRRV